MSTTFITTLFGECPIVFGATLVQRPWMEYLIYLGAILGVSALAAIWLVSTRRPRQHADDRPHHHHSSRRGLGGWFGKGNTRGSSGRTRRRRRAHRKRNPTLAETGGLPPIRSEDAGSAEPPQP